MWDSMSDSGRGIWLLLITLGVGGACLYGARALYTWWTGSELPANLLDLAGGLIRGQQPLAVAVLALLILLTGFAGLVAVTHGATVALVGASAETELLARLLHGVRSLFWGNGRRHRRHPGWVSWLTLQVCRSGAWCEETPGCSRPGSSSV